MKNRIFFPRPKDLTVFAIAAMVLFSFVCNGQHKPRVDGSIDIGVASIDITPQGPIRLTGYAGRDKKETTEVIHRLAAKAMAFGSDDQE